MQENYIGPVVVGQRWVELKGIFTLGELKAVVSKIETNFKEVFNDKEVKDTKETTEHLQNLQDAITATLNGEIEE